MFGQGIDQVLMLEQADLLDYDSDSNTSEITRSYYQANCLGSVMGITDANQSDVATYRYSPYGEVTITRSGSSVSSDPLGQGWTFTGRFSDEETGLLYYRARYYRPSTGVFLQRDPLGIASGPTPYRYASSRPAVNRDPTGLLDRGGDPTSGFEALSEIKKVDEELRKLDAEIKMYEAGKAAGIERRDRRQEAGDDIGAGHEQAYVDKMESKLEDLRAARDKLEARKLDLKRMFNWFKNEEMRRAAKPQAGRAGLAGRGLPGLFPGLDPLVPFGQDPANLPFPLIDLDFCWTWDGWFWFELKWGW